MSNLSGASADGQEARQQVPESQGLTESKPTGEVHKDQNLTFHSDFGGKIDPDLQTVIERWASLPADLRKMITYVVKASPGRNGPKRV